MGLESACCHSSLDRAVYHESVGVAAMKHIHLAQVQRLLLVLGHPPWFACARVVSALVRRRYEMNGNMSKARL